MPTTTKPTARTSSGGEVTLEMGLVTKLATILFAQRRLVSGLTSGAVKG